ncbi:unnamed protein product [Phaeothamnion confervicola]
MTPAVAPALSLARGLAMAAAAMAAGGTAVAAGRPFDYAIVVDAGSSGSRVYVYELRNEDGELRVVGRPGAKVLPGLSSYEAAPEGAGPYLMPLFDAAAAMIPAACHRTTPVFVKSTAGMRLVAEAAQQAVYDSIHAHMAAAAAAGAFPFLLPRSHLGTIDGDMEAYYAVLSTNYLEGRIDARRRPIGHPAGVLGALDMGGASTQIIFPVAGSDSDNGVDDAGSDGGSSQSCGSSDSGSSGSESSKEGLLAPSHFWSNSYLSFGVQAIRERVWDTLALSHVHGREVPNPCSFKNHREGWMGRQLVGTGDAARCTAAIRAVMWPAHSASGPHADSCGIAVEARTAGSSSSGAGDSGSSGHSHGVPATAASFDFASMVAAARAALWPSTLPPSSPARRPCPIDGVRMPALRGDFFAMSAFFFAMDCVRELGPYDLNRVWPQPSVTEIRAAVAGFCAMDWASLGAPPLLTAHRFTAEGLEYRCVEAAYMATLLGDGYGFPADSRNITFALEAAGMEVEWTLGYTLAEVAGGGDGGGLLGTAESGASGVASHAKGVGDKEGVSADAAVGRSTCTWLPGAAGGAAGRGAGHFGSIGGSSSVGCLSAEDAMLASTPWMSVGFALLTLLMYVGLARYASNFVRGTVDLARRRLRRPGSGRCGGRSATAVSSGAAAAAAAGAGVCKKSACSVSTARVVDTCIPS